MSQNTNCPNCNTPLTGQFCSNCGQNQKSIRFFLFTLINEALEDIFGSNSRAWRTTFSLLFRPGFLSKEYFNGRRASYIQPIRLYFILSIVFFLMLSFINAVSTPTEINISGVDEQTLEEIKELGTELSDVDKEAFNAKIEELKQKALIEGEIDEGLEVFSLDLGEGENIINLPFVSAENRAKLIELVETQGTKASALAKENPREFAGRMLELAPPVIFCLLPLFALLLKLVYIRKDFYYSEHLIFSIHNHCFIFLALITLNLVELLIGDTESLGSWIGSVIGIWIPVYLWLSLKNVYQQGLFLTTLKFAFLGVSYFVMLGCGIATALIIGVLTL